MIAYLSLGGNMGNRAAYLGRARNALTQNAKISLIKASPLYRTRPWGVEDQPWFLNQCLAIETSLPPVPLLRVLQRIERSLGRRRKRRWGPRTIDLDILTYGERHLDTPHLTLPHPRMFERAFVLVPLADISPDLCVLGKRIGELARYCDARGVRLL